MKAATRRAYNELKKIGAPVFDSYRDGSPVEDNTFKLSAEENYDRSWADYWDEFGFNVDSRTPGVDSEVCKIAAKHGLFFEWENPGCLTAWPE